MAAFWQIQCDAAFGLGVKRDFDDLGLSQVDRSLVSRGISTVTLESDEDIFATPMLSFKDWCVIWRDGVRWFQGSVTKLPKSASGDSERGQYVISDPWWWMTQVPARASYGAVSGTRARLENPTGNAGLTWEAIAAGVIGNDIRVRMVDPGTGNAVLGVVVAGSDITINLATNAGGDITSTLLDVVEAVAADGASNGLVTYEFDGVGAAGQTAVAHGYESLSGALAEEEIERPTIIFDAESGGTALRTGNHLETVINLMAAAGVPVQAGPSNLVGYQTIRFQSRGSTWADAVESILSWHPDAVTWWDYSTVTPTLHANVRGAMTARAVSIGAIESPEELDLSPLHELRPDRIRMINYTASVDNVLGGERRRLEEASADIVLNPTPPIREMVIDLGRGSIAREEAGNIAATYLTQRVRARTIPQTGVDAEVAEWWADHVEVLTRFREAGLDLAALKVAQADAVVNLGAQRKHHVTAHNVEMIMDGVDPPKPVNPNAVPVEGVDASDFPRELLDGQIEDWMSVRTHPLLVTSSIGMRADVVEAIGNDQMRADVKAAFPKRWEVGGVKYYFQTFSVRVMGTNAVTKTYRAPASVTITPPASQPGTLASMGLAQSLADALSVLQWGGSFTLASREAGGLDWLGRTVNITGGLGLWASMESLVQEVVEDLQTGRTTVTLGPAEQAQLPSMDELPFELPEPTTRTYGYDSEDPDEASSPGGYAQPTRGGADVGEDRFEQGPAALSVVHAFFDGATPKVVFSAAEMGEVSKGFVGNHTIGLGAEPLDGDTAVSLAAGASNNFWLSWSTTPAGVISGPVSLVDAEPGGAVFFDEQAKVAGAFKLLLYTIVPPAEAGGNWEFLPRAPIPVWQPSAGAVRRPFGVSKDGGDLSISGGAYQVGADGAWVETAGIGPTAGSFAYFVITQDGSRDVTSVALEISGTAKAALEGVSETSATSNVLLAEVVGGELKPRRHGNFTLDLWQINGDVVRWVETTGGEL